MKPDPTSLDRMHDLVAPPPVPWWPPAPGWYWVLGILLVALVYLAGCAFSRWQKNRYRREALAEYHRLTAGLSGDRVGVMTGLAELVKRAAVSAFPRTEVASLTGDGWLAFLDRSAGMKGFSSETGWLLEKAAYGTGADPGEGKAREAAALVEHWLKKHRVERSAEC